MKELTGSELGGHIKVENYWIFYIEKIILKIDATIVKNLFFQS